MHTTLFVYSATGNSYHVARRIADGLGDTDIVLLPHAGEIQVSERVGIISPVYSWVTPKAVSDFITGQLAKTHLLEIKYLFCIHTCGFVAAYAPMCTEMLLQDIGCLSSYQNTIKMPDTFVPWFSMPDAAKYNALFDKADKKTDMILQDIKTEKIRVSFKRPFGKLVKKHLRNISYSNYSRYGERLSISASCIGCGKCVRLCPNNNITLTKGGKPQFGKDCLACFACLLGCPSSAIEYGKRHKHQSYPNKRSAFDGIRK